MFSRVGDDWVEHVLTAGAVLAMPEIGIDLLLEGLDAGIDFEDAAADP